MTINISAPTVPAYTSREEINTHLENIYSYLAALAGTLNRVLPTLDDGGAIEELTGTVTAIDARVAALEGTGGAVE